LEMYTAALQPVVELASATGIATPGTTIAIATPSASARLRFPQCHPPSLTKAAAAYRVT